jgi:signal transduction histidine kinase
MILSLFRKTSLYYRLNGIIIGGMLLLSALIGIVMVRTTSRLLENQVASRGFEIATSVGAMSSNDILLDDRYALSSRITGAMNHTEEVRYIIIADFAGNLLIDTFMGKFPAGLAQDIRRASLPAPDPDPYRVGGSADSRVVHYRSDEGPICEVIVPIEKGNIGFVRVGMSERGSQALLLRTIRRFLLLTLGACLLASAGATLLAHRIVKPIHTLAGAARQIRHGNYSVRAQVPDEAEVGMLAAAFNEMAASLQAEAIEHDRLLEELRAKEMARTVLLNRLFTVQEDERRRLSRELHDESGQSLASMLAYMKLLSSKLTTGPQRELLQQTRGVALDIMGNLRKLATELRPPILDDLGLTTAMRKYVDGFRDQHGCEVACELPETEPALDGPVSLALYRILQESLVNVAKHARARAVRVALRPLDGWIELEVADDGEGASADALAQAMRSDHLGVFGMRERTELLGGRFTLDSGPAQGTTVRAILPETLG